MLTILFKIFWFIVIVDGTYFALFIAFPSCVEIVKNKNIPSGQRVWAIILNILILFLLLNNYFIYFDFYITF